MHPELSSSPRPSPPRKASGSSDAMMDASTPLRNNPTTFFMASESDLDSREKSSVLGPSFADSTFGIRSIEDTACVIDEGHGEGEEQEKENTNRNGKSRRRSTIRPQDLVTKDPFLNNRRRHSSMSSAGCPAPSQNDAMRAVFQLEPMSQPLTPLSCPSPVIGSEVPSSPKSIDGRSLRISDDDDLGDTGSQAIASDSEDLNNGSGEVHNGESVQLIMPSLAMPTRRPFTERGKQIGKLKVLIAGPSGVGKTSLIKSFVHVCEDIVHVDPLPTITSESRNQRSRARTPSPHPHPPGRVIEIHASTKPYPEWWLDQEESDSSTRRRSSGENMLERNVCFVDTPGYDKGTSILEGMKLTLDYIECQMAKSAMTGELKDSELLSMLTGSGGPQVDVVIYLITHDLKAADVEYLRQLTYLVPTIPVISKSDTIMDSSLSELKPAILEQLRTANITSFSLHETSQIPLPYAVCSSPSSDLESMDASLLMQPDFLPPLSPSDLPSLIDHLFQPKNLAVLKHASSRKLLRWRTNPRASPLPAPLSAAFGPSPSLTPSVSSPPSLPSLSLATRPQSFSSLTHPRLAMHTQREERLANIRLANWASQLQRSLAAERAKYEDLARQDRADWLKAELNKCKDLEVDFGEIDYCERSLVTVHDSGSTTLRSQCAKSVGPFNDHSRQKGFRETIFRRTRGDGIDTADPLGILKFGDKLQRSGWTAVRVLGGCGVAGGLIVLVARMGGYGQGEWGLAVVKDWWTEVWTNWNES